MNRVYFDYNATTPLAPEAAKAMQPFLNGEFGNASSSHWAGQRVRNAVEHARRQVATLIRCEPDEVVFTSGGTEANNSALAGVFFRHKKTPSPHFIITSVEHPSVAKTCDFLERLGATVTRVGVDRFGMVAPDAIAAAIRRETVLISVMHANNEVGTIQPIKEIAALARERGVLVHTDAAQTVGKIPVDVSELGVNLLSIAGHKMYGPQGVGALFVRQGVALEPWLYGAGHEDGRRAGTENVLEIVGLGAACEGAQQWIHDTRIRQLRDHFWSCLREQFGDCVVLNGHPEARLPNTLNVSFPGHNGLEILSRIPELAMSTGSACHAGSHQLSPVLCAMQLPVAVASGAIRISLGRMSTTSEVEFAINKFAQAVLANQ
jgi:cysteine desulfurase